MYHVGNVYFKFVQCWGLAIHVVLSQMFIFSSLRLENNININTNTQLNDSPWILHIFCMKMNVHMCSLKHNILIQVMCTI